MLLRTKHFKAERSARLQAEDKNGLLNSDLKGSRAHADQLQSQLDEYESLGLALPIARDIQRLIEEETQSGTPHQEAYDITTARATQLYRERKIKEQADELNVTLSDEQQIEVDQEITAQVPQMAEKIRAEVSKTKPALLEERTAKKRAELEVLETEDLLRAVDTEATALALSSLESLALERAEVKRRAEERSVWIDALASTAEILNYVPVAKIPAQEVVTVDLTDEQLTTHAHKWKRTHKMSRSLVLRLLKPELGLFEVIDDTWKESDDKLRAKLALNDGQLILLASDHVSEGGPNFSKAAVPQLHKCEVVNAAYSKGDPIELDSLEVGRVRIGKDWIMAYSE